MLFNLNPIHNIEQRQEKKSNKTPIYLKANKARSNEIPREILTHFFQQRGDVLLWVKL